MFKRVTLTACLLSLTTAAYQGPLAGGQPAALYPAGLDPKSCPNYPICNIPGQSIQPRQAASSYQPRQNFQPQRPIYQPRFTATPVVELQKYSQPEFEFVPSSVRSHNPSQSFAASPQRYVAPQQHGNRQQYVAQQQAPPQQHAAPQQYAPPQQYSSPQQYAKSSRDEQYTPEQKKALDRGEYIGDGDYHGEGLAEALAPEYRGGVILLYIPTEIKFVEEDEYKEKPTAPLYFNNETIRRPQYKQIENQVQVVQEKKNPNIVINSFISKKLNMPHYKPINVELGNQVQEVEKENFNPKTFTFNNNKVNRKHYKHSEVEHKNETQEEQYEENLNTGIHTFNNNKINTTHYNHIKVEQAFHQKQHPNAAIDTFNNNKINITHYKHIEVEHKNQTREVQTRIETAKNDLMEMKPLLCNKNVSIELRTRMVKYYVSSTLFHGMENQTLTRDDMHKLEEFEEWIHTSIFNVSWTERIQNIEIFDRMEEGMEIMKTVKTREIRCEGYIYHRRGSKHFLVDFAMNDEIQGRVRISGKKKNSWVRNVREMFGCTCIELFTGDTNDKATK